MTSETFQLMHEFVSVLKKDYAPTTKEQYWEGDSDVGILDGCNVSFEVFEFATALRNTREFRQCKFVAYNSNMVWVYFDRDATAWGLIGYREEHYIVSSKLIRRERTSGYFKFAEYSKISKNMRTAIGSAKKYLCPLNPSDIMGFVQKKTPSNIERMHKKGESKRNAALHTLRYMAESRIANVIEAIPAFINEVWDLNTRTILQEMFDNWQEAKRLDKEVENKRVIHVHFNELDNSVYVLDKLEGSHVVTHKPHEVHPDIIQKLHVLNLLKLGDSVDGVGARIAENSYAVVIDVVGE